MTEEQRIVFMRAQLLEAEIRMQGMIADNLESAYNGGGVVYTGAEFRQLIEEFGLGCNSVIQFLRGD